MNKKHQLLVLKTNFFVLCYGLVQIEKDHSLIERMFEWERIENSPFIVGRDLEYDFVVNLHNDFIHKYYFDDAKYQSIQSYAWDIITELENYLYW